MGAILLLAYAMLRQLFAGSLLIAVPMGEVEDILRSVLAIGLAIGFLLWGMRQDARDWRIASFLALGFSLIGTGWLYNCVLNEARH